MPFTHKMYFILYRIVALNNNYAANLEKEAEREKRLCMCYAYLMPTVYPPSMQEMIVLA